MTAALVLLSLLVTVVLLGLYALHRLALWLESRGQLFYLHRKPSGGHNPLRAFQDIVEPNVKHVYQMKEQKKREEHEPGSGPAE